MKVKELEVSLQTAQDRLDKAVALQNKRKKKLIVVQSEVDKLKLQGVDLDDTAYVMANWSTVASLHYDVYNKVRELKSLISSDDRKIKGLSATVNFWKTRLEIAKTKEQEFANIPNVIKEFISNWRARVETFILEGLKAYRELSKEIDAIGNKAYDYSLSREEREQANAEYSEKREFLRRTTPPIVLSCIYKSAQDIKKMLDTEEQDKVLDLVKRVTKVIGSITDASMLHIGEQNGELNGIVIGTDGRCEVKTIGAGGYNIQCYHYRVLVKKLK